MEPRFQSQTGPCVTVHTPESERPALPDVRGLLRMKDKSRRDPAQGTVERTGGPRPGPGGEQASPPRCFRYRTCKASGWLGPGARELVRLHLALTLAPNRGAQNKGTALSAVLLRGPPCTPELPLCLGLQEGQRARATARTWPASLSTSSASPVGSRPAPDPTRVRRTSDMGTRARGCVRRAGGGDGVFGKVSCHKTGRGRTLLALPHTPRPPPPQKRGHVSGPPLLQ